MTVFLFLYPRVALGSAYLWARSWKKGGIKDAIKQSKVWPPLATDAGQPTKKISPTFDGEHSVSHSTRTQSPHNNDSKFNIVLYGVEECPSGRSRSARLESDLSSVVDVLSSVDTSIQPQSVKDCFRLGKFSPSASRPRPILVKFVRIADVTKIFANKRNLSPPFSIKPDMSRAQRLQESVLMRERWCLIQSGVSRNSIRVKGDSLYLNHKLHGCVSNSCYLSFCHPSFKSAWQP